MFCMHVAGDRGRGKGEVREGVLYVTVIFTWIRDVQMLGKGWGGGCQ